MNTDCSVPSIERIKIGDYAVTEDLEVLEPGQVTTSHTILPWPDIIRSMAEEFSKQPSRDVNENVPDDQSLPQTGRFSTCGK